MQMIESHIGTSDKLFKCIVSDLQKQARWTAVISFLEKHNEKLLLRKRKSPAIYTKYKRWLLNTERLTIAQVLVHRKLADQPAMSQGELVRLLGGNLNLNRNAISYIEKKEMMGMNNYWTNQVRNNVRPIMADYFNLLEIRWEGGNRPGCGGYSIHASDLLMRFFTQELYE